MLLAVMRWWVEGSASFDMLVGEGSQGFHAPVGEGSEAAVAVKGALVCVAP